MVWIEKSQVDRLLGEGPLFAKWLLGTLANKLRLALDRVEGVHNLPARARVARLLADMAANEGPELRITQQKLSDFVGISRVTTGQILAELEAESLIERHYGRIKVIDLERIAAQYG